MLRSLLPNRLHLAAFLAVLVVGTAISAQAETVDTALLWHLDPSGATEPSYLLGTMHVSDPRVLDVPQPVLDALDQSHTAVFELITDGKVTASLASAMMISAAILVAAMMRSEAPTEHTCRPAWDSAQRPAADCRFGAILRNETTLRFAREPLKIEFLQICPKVVLG